MGTPIIRSIIGITHDVVWGVGDVYYMFAIGASAAALLLAILYYTLGVKRLQRVAPVGLVVASALGFAAPLSLIANLYQPGRFYSLFFHTHLSSSPMSWGAIVLTLYVLTVIVMDVVVYFHTKTGWDSDTPRIIGCIGAVAGFFALAVITYTGIEVSVVRSISLWHSALMPVLFLTISGVSAVSLVIVLGWLDGRIRMNQEKGFLGIFLLWFLLLDLFLQFVWLIVFVMFGGRTAGTIRQVIFHQHISSFLFVGLLLTVVLPAVLMTLPSLRRSWGPLLVASVLAAVGSWVLRWNILIVGQEIPKTSTGFNQYTLAMTGHDSVLNLIGNIALVVFFVIILEWTLEIAESGTESGVDQISRKQSKSVVDGGVAQ